MESLNEVRKKIDVIDREIVDLISERLKTVGLAIEAKRDKNLPAYDPEREEELLQEISKYAESKGLDAENVQKTFSTIVEYMRKYSEEKLK